MYLNINFIKLSIDINPNIILLGLLNRKSYHKAKSFKYINIPLNTKFWTEIL